MLGRKLELINVRTERVEAATEADKVVTVANEPLQSSLMVLLFCMEKSRPYLVATVVVLRQCFDTVEQPAR